MVVDIHNEHDDGGEHDDDDGVGEHDDEVVLVSMMMMVVWVLMSVALCVLSSVRQAG